MRFSVFLLLFFVPFCVCDDLGNVNIKCGTCALLMNEVEGFLVENKTEVELVSFLAKLCPLFHGTAQFVCDALVLQAPALLVKAENKWDVARVCVDIKMCDVPVTTEADLEPIPTFQLNYDLPPQERWSALCS